MTLFSGVASSTHNPFANGNGIVHLRAGEALRTVLEPVICMSLFRQLLQQLCALYGNLQNLFF